MNIRTITLLLAALVLLPSAFAAAAEAPAAALPAPTLWQGLIPLVVPGLVALFKFLLPKVPKVVLPILAPILGAAADVLLHFAGLSSGGALTGAILGGAGVALREAYDQSKKLATGP